MTCTVTINRSLIKSTTKVSGQKETDIKRKRMANMAYISHTWKCSYEPLTTIHHIIWQNNWSALPETLLLDLQMPFSLVLVGLHLCAARFLWSQEKCNRIRETIAEQRHQSMHGTKPRDLLHDAKEVVNQQIISSQKALEALLV